MLRLMSEQTRAKVMVLAELWHASSNRRDRAAIEMDEIVRQ